MSTPTPWQLVADEVIAAIIQDKKTYELVRYELMVNRHHFPPGPWRDAFHAIDALYLTDRPIHITTVHNESKVALEWLSERWVLARKAVLGDVLRDNVKTLREHADSFRKLVAMETGVAELRKADTPEKRAAIVSDVLTALSSSVNDSISDVSTAGAADRLAKLLEEPPAKTITTGLAWLDAQTGGIQPGHMWWVAAAYKKRKSTLMRNMVLAACEAGASVTVGLLEGSQIEFTAQMVSMLAARWLHQNGHWDKRAPNGMPVQAITAQMLLALRNRYKTELHPLSVTAVSEAIKQFRALGTRLRIYDRQPENGGLGTLASIETMVRRDIARYGVDVCFIDYLQLINAGRSSEYENVSTIARSLQQLAGETRVAMVVLAQLNEESVRYGSEGHSPGVKGGGDPAATADVLLTTGYPKNDLGEDDTSKLYVKIKLARHTAMGASETFSLHPETGWLRTGVKVDRIDLSGF